MSGDTVWIIIIVALIGLAIFGFIQTSGAKQKKEDIRSLVDSQSGFKSSHFIAKVPLSTNILAGLAVDDSSKQLCIIHGHSTRLYDYKDIIESEVVIDGKSVTKTSRASQFVGTAIGGVLAGGVGAIIGGLSGSTSTKEKVKGVSLKLIVNDTENPVHLIDFIELTNTGSTVPEQALKEAKSWHDLLSVIINQGKKYPPAVQHSEADQIERYAEMHKNGILSDEEFSAAKKKILG